jgi:hypothetical protein
MNKSRSVIYASVIAAAFGVGGVVGAAAIAVAPLITANAASPSPSPSAGSFKSNEDPTHEKGESAAQEAAENNGTFHPGGGSGPSNETPSHEASESAAREAAEKT